MSSAEVGGQEDITASLRLVMNSRASFILVIVVKYVIFIFNGLPVDSEGASGPVFISFVKTPIPATNVLHACIYFGLEG